jgi:hypothetical protein
MWEIFKKGGSRILNLAYTILIYLLAIPHYVWIFFTEADIRKINKLTENLVDDICQQAGKDIDLLDSTEVIILSTFLVSEYYYRFSEDEKKATKLLDRYITICAKKAERTLNGTPATNSKFESTFINKTRERYLEYRSILFPDHKITDKLLSACQELTKHFFVNSTNLEDKNRNKLSNMFSLIIVQHINECINSFKH